MKDGKHKILSVGLKKLKTKSANHLHSVRENIDPDLGIQKWRKKIKHKKGNQCIFKC